jgi:hypothetical protein
VDFFDFNGRTGQVLSKTLRKGVLSDDDVMSIEEKDYGVLTEFIEASSQERDELLQKLFLTVPCVSVTILYSYTEDGYLTLTMNSPTYHQLLEAITGVSSCGFNGEVTVDGDRRQGYVVV